MKNFVVGILRWSYFLASNYGTFLLVIRMNLVIQNRPSTCVIKKNKLHKNKSGRTCSQRAQLLGITLHRLRGRKLVDILIFYVGQKICGRIYAPIGVKLLTPLLFGPRASAPYLKAVPRF